MPKNICIKNRAPGLKTDCNGISLVQNLNQKNRRQYKRGEKNYCLSDSLPAYGNLLYTNFKMFLTIQRRRICH